MTYRRISRGTPYVLSAADLEAALSALTPQLETDLAGSLRMPAEEWRKLPDRLKVKHMLEHQTRGVLAASMAAATKAQTDLQEAATAITDAAVVDTLRDEVKALTELVHEMRGGSVPTKTKRTSR